MGLRVAVIMGSDSDFGVMEAAVKRLHALGVESEVRVISAHRTPVRAAEFASGARDAGFGVIIAAAGKAAHLAGVIAAHTILPVVGVPIKTGLMGGLDSLLSTVQMPGGVPVATVAVDGAENAAILAAQILAVSDAEIADRLLAAKEAMAEEVRRKDLKIKEMPV